MNFFRRLRKTNVTVLDDTAGNVETVANSSGRSSSGLRRSGAISTSNGYHDSETKLFVEAPIASTEHLVKPPHAYAQQGYAQADPVEMAASTAVRIHPDALGNEPSPSANRQFNLNNNHYGEATNPQTTQQVTQEPLDGSKVNKLMELYAAIIRGEKSEVKKILTVNLDLLEAPDNFGRTPLMYCVLADRLECAKLLLKMKCKLDQVDKAGRSALHLAAHKASYKFLELLHDRGGNIEMKDNDGQTPLHLTTRNRHARCLDFLLKRLSPGMVDVPDQQNRTALHWSAAFSNADYVKQLIKHNSNIAMPDAEGKTPLHWAANTHDHSAVPTMKPILEHASGVLNWQDYDGRTALHFAVAHENVAAVEYLLQFQQETCEVDRLDNSFRTPLHWAAQLGNTQIVKLLLSVGAKNSITDSNGATPLLYAALNNHSDVVLEMIKHDVNILEQADIEGRSALMWAAGKGATDVIQTLLALNDPAASVEKKFEESTLEFLKVTSKTVHDNSKLKQAVDINRTDNKGNTALHMAAWNGHAHSSEILLRNKARHDFLNNMNHTPLFGACEKGHLNVVKHVLDYNASIDLTDHEERSPLHWAALGGHAEVCDLLITKGLDPDLRDSYQRSPLHCAAFGGFINCMNLLLENGANVDLQDKEGLSALHWAAQSGQLDATKLLFQCSAFPNLMEFTEERLTPLDHALLNDREEVAQYLIEQGALSSETIRDIAAARIQACYRGFQVRKAFLTRKNLLVKHAMLRNQNKGKRRPNNAESLDHLNGVNEEIVPKSPNADSAFADSVYSGDGSRQDPLEDNVFPVQTIKSTLNVSIRVEPTEKPPASPGASEASLESALTHGQQNEDPTVLKVPELKIQKQESVPIPAIETNDQINKEAEPKQPTPTPADETGENTQQECASQQELTNETEPTKPDDIDQNDGNGSAASLNDGDKIQHDEQVDTQSPVLEVKPARVSLEPSSDDMLITDGYLSPHDVSEDLSVNVKVPETSAINEENAKNLCPDSCVTPLSPVEVLPEESQKIGQLDDEPVEVTATPPPTALSLKHTTATDTSAKETTEEVIKPPKKPKRKKKHREPKISPSPEVENICSNNNTTQTREDASAGADENALTAPPPSSEHHEEHKQKTPEPHVVTKEIEPDYHKKRENTPKCLENPLQSQCTEESKITVTKPAKSSAVVSVDQTVKTSSDPVVPKEVELIQVVPQDPKLETLHLPVPDDSEHKTKKRKEHRKKRKSRKENNNKHSMHKSVEDSFSQLIKEESVVMHKVEGLAYKTDESEPLFPDDSAMMNVAVDPKSELSFSEYIESLMSLSPGERKALETLQRNRKYAFKRANAAAVTIQRAWRRYYKAKYPKRKLRKAKKTVKVKPASEQPPKTEAVTTTPSRPSSSRPQTLNYQVTRVSVHSKSDIPLSDPADNDTIKDTDPPPEPKFSVKVSKKKRPHTSYINQSAQEGAWPSSGALQDFANNDSHQDQCIDDDAAHPAPIRKSKKLRPKTEHRSVRQSRLLFPANVDTSDDKFEQLCKIYGQTLVLHDMYYPTSEQRPSKGGRFRTVAAPSTRPKTSRAALHNYKYDDEYNFMDSVHIHDPVTAVQTLDWKPDNRKNGSVRKSKTRRSPKAKKYRFQESEVAKMPVQWQKIHSELKRGPMQKPASAVPTRFSYNMRNNF